MDIRRYSAISDVPMLWLHPLPRGHAWSEDAFTSLLAGLERLRTDHKSGAKELATIAVGILVQVAATVSSGLARLRLEQPGLGKDELSETWWESTRRAGWAISRHGRPSMGAAITTAIIKTLRRAESGLSEGKGAELAGHSRRMRWKDAVSEMERYLEERSGGTQGIVGTNLRDALLHFFHYREDKSKWDLNVLTLSSSSTIRQALMTLLQLDADQGGGMTIHLRIMESRPLCEGVDLAKALTRFAANKGLVDKLTIEIGTDASVAILARDVDVLLLGADRISAAGDVSNKTGSLPAVLSARLVSPAVRVLVVSELEKIAARGGMEDHGEEGNDPGEVVAAWQGKIEDDASGEVWTRMVSVKNVYFEWVPAKYIDGYLCEHGLLSVESIQQYCNRSQEAEKRMFSDFDEMAVSELSGSPSKSAY